MGLLGKQLALQAKFAVFGGPPAITQNIVKHITEQLTRPMGVSISEGPIVRDIFQLKVTRLSHTGG